MYEIYQLPFDSTWSAFCLGVISDGFETEINAYQWVIRQISQYSEKQHIY